LSTTIAPVVQMIDAANAAGNAFMGTLAGGMNNDGTVQTRGATGGAIQNVSMQDCSSVNGVDATGSGLCVTANGEGATAYGSNANATGDNSTAMGYRATTASANTVAIGAGSIAAGQNGTAVGVNSRASGAGSVAVGYGASAPGANSVAIGQGSVATEDNTVSFGAAGTERRLTNIAAGIAPTDAATVSQLGNVQSNVNNVARTAYAGTALAMAMSGTYLPSLNAGEKTVGVGFGSYQGYSAVAVNFKGLSGNGRWGYGAGVSTTGHDVGVNAGVGWKW
jgi:autotransporter adhesin